MILATIGTNEQPFDRLVRAVADLRVDEPLIVQYGSSSIRGEHGEWIDFMSFDQLAERMREARVVICHAGVGSIMLARRCGRRPLVVPRRLHLGEAVDDHQLGIARRLHEWGLVTLVEDESRLAELAAAADGDGTPGRIGGSLSGASALAEDIRGFLREAGLRARDTDG